MFPPLFTPFVGRRRDLANVHHMPPVVACKFYKDRIGFLKQTAAPFKKLQAQSQEEYEGPAADLYGNFRETWERAIEEVLLQDVIQRFRPSVETQRLKRVMIENVDYPLVARNAQVFHMDDWSRFCGCDWIADSQLPLKSIRTSLSLRHS